MKYIVLDSMIIFFSLIILGVIVLFNVNAAWAEGANQNATVIVDLVGFTPPPERVSIQVPEYIYLGNLSKKTMKTNETQGKYFMNNTGNVNISVTPMLINSSDEMFSYLYFRRILSDKQGKIGNWSLYIEAPDEEKGYEEEQFYVQLNLANFTGEIKEDVIGRQTQIEFIAMKA